MSSHSIAEAKERFPELIDRALQGEPVVITRDGAPVLELRPVAAMPSRPVTEEGIAWLRQNLLVPSQPKRIDAVAVVRQMRDED